MPNIIIHEEIAYRIAKNKNEYLNSDFFLGILAPDTPNLYGFGPKEERWLAHQRKKDLTEWKDNLIKFYNQEKNNYPKYFIEGYLTHILTDIIYDRDFYKKVRKEIINDGYEKRISSNNGTRYVRLFLYI